MLALRLVLSTSGHPARPMLCSGPRPNHRRPSRGPAALGPSQYQFGESFLCVIQRQSGGLGVAIVDHFGRSAYRQLYRLLSRFGGCLGFLQDKLKLLVVVGTDARLRVFTRLLNHPRLQRIVPDSPGGLGSAIKFYRVRRAVPVIRSLEPVSRDLRELRALGPLRDRQSHSVQQNEQPTHNRASHKDDPGFWIE